MGAVLTVALCALPAWAAGQEASSASQRQAAAEAFDRGTAAYLARNWAPAAEWFETAHRLAPAAPALLQALKSHQRAGNELRAATLALRMRALYPDSRGADTTAQRLVRRAAQRFFRVDVTCEDCRIDLDGTLVAHPSFFLAADTPHRIVAHFDTGELVREVQGEAGARRELGLVAPPPPPPEPIAPEPAPEPQPTGPTARPAPPPAGDDGGIAPALFIVSAGLAIAATAITVWSGLDTVAGVNDYEAMPTAEALADGQARETRTNVLIGVTAALVATTITLAVLTDWDGEQETRPAVAVTPSGVLVGVQGRFK